MALHFIHRWSLFIAFICAGALADFRWIDDRTNPGYNCPGKVTDAICCQDNNACSARTQSECLYGNRQSYCQWSNNQCTVLRDDANNVCCQSEVKEACDKVARGLCPSDWQVPERCCSALGQKYNGTLVGVKQGFVCCNAPCTEMQAAGCPLPATCAPGQRSLRSKRPQPKMLGFQPALDQYALGQILSGTGFGGDYALGALNSFQNGNSKKQQVDEITVDDLMNMLIDSLSADKDAMVYNAEMNSDPYLGKLFSGGKQVNMNLPNPGMFLDQIYGNPYGLSDMNFGNFPSLSNPYGPMGGFGGSPFYPQLPGSTMPQYPSPVMFPTPAMTQTSMLPPPPPPPTSSYFAQPYYAQPPPQPYQQPPQPYLPPQQPYYAQPPPPPPQQYPQTPTQPPVQAYQATPPTPPPSQPQYAQPPTPPPTQAPYTQPPAQQQYVQPPPPPQQQYVQPPPPPQYQALPMYYQQPPPFFQQQQPPPTQLPPQYQPQLPSQYQPPPPPQYQQSYGQSQAAYLQPPYRSFYQPPPQPQYVAQPQFAGQPPQSQPSQGGGSSTSPSGSSQPVPVAPLQTPTKP